MNLTNEGIWVEGVALSVALHFGANLFLLHLFIIGLKKDKIEPSIMSSTMVS